MSFNRSLVALAVSVCMFGSVVVAAPPSGAGNRGPSSGLRGNERRALNSRQQLFDRAAAAAQNRTIPTRPTAPLPTAANLGQSIAEMARTSQTVGRDLFDRTPTPATAARNVGSSQSAAGRFGRDISPSLRRPARPTFSQQDARRPVIANTRRQDFSNIDRMRRADGTRSSVGRSQRPLHTQADRILANRLADIDHQRDIAFDNGNEQLLQRADTLEQIARDQHQKRVDGGEFERLETQSSPAAGVDGTRGNRFGRMTGRTGFDDNRRTNTDDATVAGDFNSEFGRQTAAAAREGRDNFGRDTADEARTRRSEVTRGSSSERATRSRSRRTFGESIRNGFRRIGTALRLPGLNRRASR